MQTEITEAGKLLNDRGELRKAGYARELLLTYDRSTVKAGFWRIKEWDYYLVSNRDFGVALTVADNSYMGLISVSFLDFRKAVYKTSSIIKPFTFGKLKLPASSKRGNIEYEDKRIRISFVHTDHGRKLQCHMKNFDGAKGFECSIELFNEPADSMVIATPFKQDKKAFYYNQKINGLRAKGSLLYGDDSYVFSPDDSFGTLDWGRGVWTYKNTWYWGSASGVMDGKAFGFNIGYGFGDTTAATENMLFYEGIAHKLDQVTFHIPSDTSGTYEYMKPWKFDSNDGRLEMDFHPILDRKDHTSIIVISSNQHQVFGTFTGKAVLDDGTVLPFKDVLGFAERVENRW
ncbi:MAG: DUF2804 domain-containing protein [Bacillus sp. (in: firmicutes)]